MLMTLLSKFLIPNLSMTRANRCAAAEVHSVLSHLDARDRYSIYSQWQVCIALVFVVLMMSVIMQ